MAATFSHVNFVKAYLLKFKPSTKMEKKGGYTLKDFFILNDFQNVRDHKHEGEKILDLTVLLL